MNIQYNTAKLAKEKGFNLSCNGYYDVDKNYELGYIYCYRSEVQNSDLYMGCTVPTQSELQKWLREVHNLFVIIDYNGKFEYTKWFYTIKSDTNQKVFDGGYWDTYEECLEVALLESLKLI